MDMLKVISQYQQGVLDSYRTVHCSQPRNREVRVKAKMVEFGRPQTVGRGEKLG